MSGQGQHRAQPRHSTLTLSLAVVAVVAVLMSVAVMLS
jgi:hypothetical protein